MGRPQSSYLRVGAACRVAGRATDPSPGGSNCCNGPPIVDCGRVSSFFQTTADRGRQLLTRGLTRGQLHHGAPFLKRRSRLGEDGLARATLRCCCPPPPLATLLPPFCCVGGEFEKGEMLLLRRRTSDRNFAEFHGNKLRTNRDLSYFVRE